MATRLKRITTATDGALRRALVALAPGCGLAGRTLGQVSQDLGISLVALKRPGTPTRLQPPPDEVLQAGDHLVVVGDQSGVERLARLAHAP